MRTSTMALWNRWAHAWFAATKAVAIITVCTVARAARASSSAPYRKTWRTSVANIRTASSTRSHAIHVNFVVFKSAWQWAWSVKQYERIVHRVQVRVLPIQPAVDAKEPYNVLYFQIVKTAKRQKISQDFALIRDVAYSPNGVPHCDVTMTALIESKSDLIPKPIGKCHVFTGPMRTFCWYRYQCFERLWIWWLGAFGRGCTSWILLGRNPSDHTVVIDCARLQESVRWGSQGPFILVIHGIEFFETRLPVILLIRFALISYILEDRYAQKDKSERFGHFRRKEKFSLVLKANINWNCKKPILTWITLTTKAVYTKNSFLKFVFFSKITEFHRLCQNRWTHHTQQGFGQWTRLGTRSHMRLNRFHIAHARRYYRLQRI